MLKAAVLERIVSLKERLSGTPESAEIINKVSTRLINVLDLTEQNGGTVLNESLELLNKLEREHKHCQASPLKGEMEEAYRQNMMHLIFYTIEFEARKHLS